MLDQETVVGHVYEAFSILSDAQELLPLRKVAAANEMVAHAKEHLGEVLPAALMPCWPLSPPVWGALFSLRRLPI